jgi:hypothetical protein
MKILMTGFTPRTVGSTKLLYSYMSNTSVIVKGLRAAGHEVDQRIVDVDDTSIAQQYDVALIGIAVPQSLSSRFWFGAMWAAEQFGPERTRFFVDDWLLHQMASQLDSNLRNPEKRMFSLPQRHCYEQAKAHTATWVKWFKHLRSGRYQLLIPAFPWARPRVLLPELSNVQPVIFDPTPLALTDPQVMCGADQWPTIVNAPMSDRRKQWVLAAMRDVGPWLEKQRFAWPLEQYGNKRQDQPIVTEEHLVSVVYPTSAGIIGAPYPKVTAGGGWRARYIHAALTNSVLFLDPDEGRTAGPPYNLFRTVVEGASDAQLEDIAGKQREHLFAKTWTLPQLHEQLDAYVKGEAKAHV